MNWMSISALLVYSAVSAVFSFAGDEPTPTPTPSPTSEPAAQATPTRTPIVISNENLKELASEGRITTAASKPATTKPAMPESTSGRDYDRSRARAAEAAQAGAAGSMDPAAMNPAQQRERKAFWQNRYKQQVIRIDQLESQLEAMNREIPRLTSEYYSKDDPYYRDAVLKPKLDEMIAAQKRLKEQLVEERELLPKIVREARKDGAEPGWFRGL